MFTIFITYTTNKTPQMETDTIFHQVRLTKKIFTSILSSLHVCKTDSLKCHYNYLQSTNDIDLSYLCSIMHHTVWFDICSKICAHTKTIHVLLVNKISKKYSKGNSHEICQEHEIFLHECSSL